jgi:enterochelin esterase-like enzyme
VPSRPPVPVSRRTAVSALGLSAAAVALGSCPGSGRRSAISPVVHGDRRVTFTLTAPAATTVAVTGSWQTSRSPTSAPTPQPLAKRSRGSWTVTIGPLKPNFYTYNFLVDSLPTRDPANRDGARASAVLTTFLVAGPGAEFLTRHDVPHGAVRTLTYRSAVTAKDRRATVWTPPGYSRRRRPYPTLYLVHGGGGDHLDWVVQGRANVILDNLFAGRRLAPMVVVMPDGNVPGAGGLPHGDRFAAEILDNLAPAVERGYHVSGAAPDRALAGLSRGGLQTWNLLLTRPGAMAYIGDFSAGYPPWIIDSLATEYPDLLSDPRINAQTRLHRIYVGNANDVVHPDNINTRAMFDRFGIRYQFSEYPDSGHTWETWRVNLHDFAPRLFR